MGDTFLIDVRLVDIETGEIVWSDSIAEKLSRYDFIGTYFAEGILSEFEEEKEEATTGRVAEEQEKNEEALIALSEGIEAYDRGDEKRAKEKLSKSNAIDPKNEVTAYYLSKLVVNTSRFKSRLEPFTTYQNPAFLGIIRTDTILFSANLPPGYTFTSLSNNRIDGFNMTEFDTDKYISEESFNMLLSYSAPLGEKWGLRTSISMSGFSDRPWESSYTASNTVSRVADGILADVGYSFTNNWSLGIGLGVYVSSYADRGPAAPFVQPDKAVYMGTLGMLYRTLDEKLIFDSSISLSSETYDTIDETTLQKTDEVMTPFLWENTLTWSFNKKRSSLIVKQQNSICFDRISYYGTLAPAFEQVASNWFAVRAGGEISFAQLNTSSQVGYGGLIGFSFFNPKRTFEFDLNTTYRLRPSRAIEELLYPDFILHIAFVFNDIALSR